MRTSYPKSSGNESKEEEEAETRRTFVDHVLQP